MFAENFEEKRKRNYDENVSFCRFLYIMLNRNAIKKGQGNIKNLHCI